jgi:hypothetical protein
VLPSPIGNGTGCVAVRKTYEIWGRDPRWAPPLAPKKPIVIWVDGESTVNDPRSHRFPFPRVLPLLPLPLPPPVSEGKRRVSHMITSKRRETANWISTFTISYHAYHLFDHHIATSY